VKGRDYEEKKKKDVALEEKHKVGRALLHC
jgi:hypothetical protein